MNDTQYILDLAADKFTFVPDLASVLRLDPINPAVVFYLQAASLRQGTCLTLQVPGFRICTDQPKMASCPFIVSVAGADDFVCLCFKGNGSSHYLYGLSVEEVMKWEPPEKGDESEESVLRLINLKNASLLGAGELANTETCDLKDKVERLLKYLPTFNKIMPKVTTVKGLDAWVNRDFSANANAAVKAAEIRDRAGSRSKGVLAGKIGEGSVSAALGGDNKITWAETLKLLKQSAPYYDHSFSDRFILIENPADVSTARDFLKGHEHESLLIEGLAHFENVQDKLSEVVYANTPWQKLVTTAEEAPPGGEEGGPAGGGRSRREGPLLSAAAQATLKATEEAAAKEAAAATGAAAKGAKAVPARAAPRAPRAASKAKANEEPESAPSPKAAKKEKGSRLTTSAASILHAELATLRADKQAAAAKATKTAKEHDAALTKLSEAAASWKAKHDHLLSVMGLELQLKEAQVKNSMMAVAWTAHTSALTMRLGSGAFSTGGLAGSPIPDGTPTQPPNPFSGFA